MFELRGDNNGLGLGLGGNPGGDLLGEEGVAGLGGDSSVGDW